MSLKDKASKINFSGLPSMVPTEPGLADRAKGDNSRPKTAPGLMMALAVDQRSEIIRDNDRLTTEIATLGEQVATANAEKDNLAAKLQDVLHDFEQWNGAKATRLLDTSLVVRSRWANRDERNFVGDEFDQLRQEIASSGGNIQPIKVRPVTLEGVAKFEVVFGHRRFEACRQLGLPVLAMIDALDDQTLFVEMDRENRLRKNLSAWEQGVMYRRALDSGLWPSSRKMADALNVDLTNLGKALSLARLPDEVVTAFQSPMDLQFRWATQLVAAVEARGESVKTCAKEIAALDPRPAPGEIFRRLIAADAAGGSTVLPPTSTTTAEIISSTSGKVLAQVKLDLRSRKISIQFVDLTAKRIDAQRLANGLSSLLNSLVDEEVLLTETGSSTVLLPPSQVLG